MPSIKEIAIEAGVSHPTVSRVLNGRGKELRIAEKTQRKVLETARRMGYCRDEVARAVKTGKSNVVGFFSNPVRTESYAELLNGVMRVSLESGYFVKVIQIDLEDSAMRIADICQGQRLAGALFYGLKDQAFAETIGAELKRRGIPFVLTSDHCIVEGASQVASDDDMAGRLVFEHLYSLGHRRFMLMDFDIHKPGKFFLPSFTKSPRWSIRRFEGFINAAAKAGIDLSSLRISDDQSYEDEDILKIIRGDLSITAFYLPTDYAALALLTKLLGIGVGVPGEVSIVGHGDILLSQCCLPTLSTVSERRSEIGARSLKTLLENIAAKGTEADSIGKTDRIGVELITRGSSGKARKVRNDK